MKNEVLELLQEKIVEKKEKILEENRKDLALFQGSDALRDRLELTEKRIDEIIENLQTIIELADPLGSILEERDLTGINLNGMKLRKISVPIGKIGIIYESRPAVTIDAFALCFKSGNKVVLKGGKEAKYTNNVFFNIIRETLERRTVDKSYASMIFTRKELHELLQQKDIDLIIPRGGESLINYVSQNTKIPLLKHDKGVCNLYIDKEADREKAIAIAVNAKCQRPGVCNAIENLIIHKDWKYKEELLKELEEKGVDILNEEYEQEFLDLRLSVKIVATAEEAISFIKEFGSGHSEAIVTEKKETAKKFLKEIDAAVVYHNASTRFTDGSCFGMGAEMGISTQKLHARGPVGLQELTTYKYIVEGEGNVR